MKRKLATGLARLIELLGFHVKLERIARADANSAISDQLNLNIGAGTYVLPHFKSLDIYTPHYYKSREAFAKERVAYDIRKDDIPYGDGTVDNIYINHVIEHIESTHIARFMEQAHRVLKPGGVLRIGCPDSEFLFEVSAFDNEYWAWRTSWFKKNRPDMPPPFSQFDAMVGMLATQRLDGHTHGVDDLRLTEEAAQGIGYAELMKQLRTGTEFRHDHPGDHINNWDYARIRTLGNAAGFAHIVRSKAKGSVSKAMQGILFDNNHNHMSLYVDLVK